MAHETDLPGRLRAHGGLFEGIDDVVDVYEHVRHGGITERGQVARAREAEERQERAVTRAVDRDRAHDGPFEGAHTSDDAVSGQLRRAVGTAWGVLVRLGARTFGRGGAGGGLARHMDEARARLLRRQGHLARQVKVGRVERPPGRREGAPRAVEHHASGSDRAHDLRCPQIEGDTVYARWQRAPALSAGQRRDRPSVVAQPGGEVPADEATGARDEGLPCGARPGGRRCGGHYASRAFRTTAALWPPKANDSESAQLIGAGPPERTNRKSASGVTRLAQVCVA